MENVIQFAALGTGTGATLGLLAVGIVLIFRGAGVLNLSHGACAMFSGYVYYELRSHNVAFVPALVAGVLVSALIGLATDQALLRWLRNASSLTRLIATMGVLLLIQSVTVRIWGAVPKTVAPILPSRPLHIGNITLPSDRLWLLLIAVLITALVAGIWRHTRLGWIAEAVSENQRLAATLGWSPGIVSGVTWFVGAGLAGLAGILIAPITELDTTTLPLLVVPALAAALIGGFRSFPVTMLGALVIGVLQSETAQYVNIPGATDALPFVVIVLGLVARGSALPLRGHATDRLPHVGSGRVHWGLLLAVGGSAIAALATMSSLNWLGVLTSTAAVGIILLSFVVLIGYTGQVSLAQYAIAGSGALIAAQLVTKAGLPFWLALIVGALGAGVVGAIFALPALRTRGVNLAVVTLGLALAAKSLVFDNPHYAGGDQGIAVPSPSIFGWNIDPIMHPQRYAIFAFVAFVLLALGVARLRKSGAGRMLLAIRDNERAAAASGVNVVFSKILGFVIAGIIAGVGGIVLSFQSVAISFSGYDPLSSIAMLAYSVVGGVGYLLGPLFGAILSPSSVGSIISLHLQNFTVYIPIIGAAALLITVVTNPHGWIHEMLRPLAPVMRRLDALTASRLRRRSILKLGRTPPPSVEPTTLTVENLTVRYGGVVAVDAVDLQVAPGKIVGLIGPNGAGKTSFMDAVTGYARPSGGSVRLNSLSIAGWPAHRRSRAGLVRSFQNLELYPDLTVRENVLTACDRHDVGGALSGLVLRRRSEREQFVASILNEFGLLESSGKLPDELSYGQRRLLAIARAVAAQPSVLLLDEPVAGLDDAESREFGTALKALASEWGMSILVIEHDMNFVMGFCDHLVVINFGRKITEGSPSEVRANEHAIAAYLGEEDDSGRQTKDLATSEDSTQPGRSSVGVPGVA